MRIRIEETGEQRDIVISGMKYGTKSKRRCLIYARGGYLFLARKTSLCVATMWEIDPGTFRGIGSKRRALVSEIHCSEPGKLIEKRHHRNFIPEARKAPLFGYVLLAERSSIIEYR